MGGFIVDQETGKNVANIRDGVVYRDDREGARIGTCPRRLGI
jgi:hypothetical protein